MFRHPSAITIGVRDTVSVYQPNQHLTKTACLTSLKHLRSLSVLAMTQATFQLEAASTVSKKCHTRSRGRKMTVTMSAKTRVLPWYSLWVSLIGFTAYFIVRLSTFFRAMGSRQFIFKWLRNQEECQQHTNSTVTASPSYHV